MGGEPTKRNQNLYYQYHQDQGHITDDYKTLCDFLKQLVKVGKLKKLTHQPSGQGEQIGPGYQWKVAACPPLGTINIIFVAPNKEAGPLSKVMATSPQLKVREEDTGSKRIKTQFLAFWRPIRLVLSSPMMMLLWSHSELRGLT